MCTAATAVTAAAAVVRRPLVFSAPCAHCCQLHHCSVCALDMSGRRLRSLACIRLLRHASLPWMTSTCHVCIRVQWHPLAVTADRTLVDADHMGMFNAMAAELIASSTRTPGLNENEQHTDCAWCFSFRVVVSTNTLFQALLEKRQATGGPTATLDHVGVKGEACERSSLPVLVCASLVNRLFSVVA